MQTQARIDAATARTRLRADPDIGMGNYLWKALDAYPDETEPIVSMRPLQTAWGERFKSLTLRQLARLADAYARRYAGLGVGRNDPVGVYVDHGAKYLLHFLALTRIGAIPVLTNERMSPEMTERHMRRIGVVGVFTDEPRRAGLAATHANFGFTVVEDDFAHMAIGDPVPYGHDDRDPILITHSSGTTGVPKAVVLEHASFFFPVAQALDVPPDPPTQRVLSALPPSHNAAITAASTAIVTGRKFFLMSESDGPSVLRAIERCRPTSVVAFPQTYVDILASGPDTYDLSSVAMWFNLGDAAHERHIRQLLRFGSHRRGRLSVSGSQFIDGLGSSEVGSTVFSIVHSPGTNHFGRCVGRPRPWVDATTLNPDGTETEPGEPGLMAIKSPSVSAGYWNDSNRTYGAHLRGYFLTGDVAVRDRHGRFFHLDRITDTVRTHQGPIYTLLYEEVLLREVDELLDCSVVAVQTRPGEAYSVCLAVLRDGVGADPDALRKEIDAALLARGLQALNDVRVVDRHDLAVGVTGKVLKAQLREALRRDLEQDGNGPRDKPAIAVDGRPASSSPTIRAKG